MLLCRLQLLGTLLCQEEHRRKWRPKRREREQEGGGGGWGSEDEKRRKLFSLFFFTILMFQSYNRLNYFFSIKIVWKNPLQTAITFFSLTPPIGSLDYYNRQISLTALIYMCIYIFVTSLLYRLVCLDTSVVSTCFTNLWMSQKCLTLLWSCLRI